MGMNDWMKEERKEAGKGGNAHNVLQHPKILHTVCQCNTSPSAHNMQMDE